MGTELARELLRCLKRWRDMNKLKRMCIAAIAKRLEEDHPSKKFARTSYRLFSGSQDELQCSHFAHELVAALESGGEAPDKSCSSSSLAGSSDDFGRFGGTSSFSKGKSLTGFHVRERVGNSINRLTRRIS